MPFGSEVVVIASGGLFTCKARTTETTVPVGKHESERVMVTLNVPLCVGVPEITPVLEAMLRPVGNPLPPQVIGLIPPVPCMVKL